MLANTISMLQCSPNHLWQAISLPPFSTTKRIMRIAWWHTAAHFPCYSTTYMYSLTASRADVVALDTCNTELLLPTFHSNSSIKFVTYVLRGEIVGGMRDGLVFNMCVGELFELCACECILVRRGQDKQAKSIRHGSNRRWAEWTVWVWR